MIKKLLPLLLLILIGCSEPEPEILEYKSLVTRDGLHYRFDNDELYTGPVINIYKNGINQDSWFDGKKNKGYIKEGLFDGPFKSYYENGQIQVEVNFKDGVYEGFCFVYWKNGNVQIVSKYENGVLIDYNTYPRNPDKSTTVE